MTDPLNTYLFFLIREGTRAKDSKSCLLVRSTQCYLTGRHIDDHAPCPAVLNTLQDQTIVQALQVSYFSGSNRPVNLVSRIPPGELHELN